MTRRRTRKIKMKRRPEPKPPRLATSHEQKHTENVRRRLTREWFLSKYRTLDQRLPEDPALRTLAGFQGWLCRVKGRPYLLLHENVRRGDKAAGWTSKTLRVYQWRDTESNPWCPVYTGPLPHVKRRAREPNRRPEVLTEN